MKRIFPKELRRVNESKVKGWQHFCNLDCQKQYQTVSVEVPCGKCGKPVTRDPSELKKSKSGLSFCSKSCACAYNNTVCRKGEDHPNHKLAAQRRAEGIVPAVNGSSHYRTICFAYHEKNRRSNGFTKWALWT